MTPVRVIRTYLLLAGLSTLSASLIWGVNTLFLLDARLDIAEVFVAATLVSFDSVVDNLGSVGGQVGLGVVARERGIGEGYVVGGVATALALPFLLALRLVGADPDRIPAGEVVEEAVVL